MQQYMRGAELTPPSPYSAIGPECRYAFSCPRQRRTLSSARICCDLATHRRAADAGLTERVRRAALEVAGIFGVDWAARIDLIYETETDRLRFLDATSRHSLGRIRHSPRASKPRVCVAPNSCGCLLNETTDAT